MGNAVVDDYFKGNTTLVTGKSIKCKEIIKKHATDFNFGGTLSDKEVMAIYNISRNSYCKYKCTIKLADCEPDGKL